MADPTYFSIEDGGVIEYQTPSGSYVPKAIVEQIWYGRRTKSRDGTIVDLGGLKKHLEGHIWSSTLTSNEKNLLTRNLSALPVPQVFSIFRNNLTVEIIIKQDEIEKSMEYTGKNKHVGKLLSTYRDKFKKSFTVDRAKITFPKINTNNSVFSDFIRHYDSIVLKRSKKLFVPCQAIRCTVGVQVTHEYNVAISQSEKLVLEMQRALLDNF